MLNSQCSVLFNCESYPLLRVRVGFCNSSFFQVPRKRATSLRPRRRRTRWARSARRTSKRSTPPSWLPSRRPRRDRPSRPTWGQTLLSARASTHTRWSSRSEISCPGWNTTLIKPAEISLAHRNIYLRVSLEVRIFYNVTLTRKRGGVRICLSKYIPRNFKVSL